MNSIVNLLKRWQITRILVVLLAGVLLFVGTACTSENVSRSSNSGESSPYRIQDNTATHLKETYSTEPRQGGMNEHLDTDAKRDLSSPAAKADRLIEQSQRNLQRRASNPKEAVDNFQNTGLIEKAGDKLDNVSESIGQSVREMKKGAERGVTNLKENIESATDRISDNVQQTVK